MTLVSSTGLGETRPHHTSPRLLGTAAQPLSLGRVVPSLHFWAWPDPPQPGSQPGGDRLGDQGTRPTAAALLAEAFRAAPTLTRDVFKMLGRWAVTRRHRNPCQVSKPRCPGSLGLCPGGQGLATLGPITLRLQPLHLLPVLLNGVLHPSIHHGLGEDPVLRGVCHGLAGKKGIGGAAAWDTGLPATDTQSLQHQAEPPGTTHRAGNSLNQGQGSLASLTLAAACTPPKSCLSEKPFRIGRPPAG